MALAPYCLAALFAILHFSAQAPALELLGSFPSGWESAWQRQQLGGAETRYRAVAEGGQRVLRADSESAATAFFRRVELRSEATSISWRWRVQRSLSGIRDERERSGDDYAARLFVIFGSGELRRDTRAICYVWAGKMPVGSSYRSPYVDGVQTIVLQSGDERAGGWVEESRDFAADYRRAFGEEPPGIGAVALLVDTDNTGGRATAWYDDIVIR